MPENITEVLDTLAGTIVPSAGSTESSPSTPSAPSAPNTTTLPDLVLECGDEDEEDERLECNRCDDKIDDGDEYTRNGTAYCQDCYNELYVDCVSCGYSMSRDNAYEHDGEDYCGDCHEDLRNDEEVIPEREFSGKNLPEFQSKEQGEYIKSDRIFSAEIECYYDDGDTMRDACADIPRAYGVSHDGSLDDGGIEFQTPKLQGKAGEDSIKSVCAILDDAGFTTNRSTGLHIHLDGAGLMPKNRTKSTPIELQDLFCFYLLYEDVLLSFLPPSRRSNRFCGLLRSAYHYDEVMRCQSLEELEKMWYREEKRTNLKRLKGEKYNSTRYAGVNFHSLLANGHIEIRYHSGTITPVKILEWANLHQTILDKASSRDLPVQKSTASITDLKEKTAKMFEDLRLPERAREYFLKRQSLFTSVRTDNDEAICAG